MPRVHLDAGVRAICESSDLPCGEGDASTASAQGVTADQITIGYGDDAGYAAAPGLNHHQSDAIKAMIQWCNDQGGINGRQIKGNYYDAKILDVNNVMQSACGEVFMLDGELHFGWTGDGHAKMAQHPLAFALASDQTIIDDIAGEVTEPESVL